MDGDPGAFTNALRLRTATDADWAMVRRWLHTPAVEKWWGPASAAEAEVIKALGARHAIARIIEWQGRPVGYAHAIDAMTWGEQLPASLEPGTWDMDIFIAEPAARGCGLGPEALAELRREVFSTTLATAVCVFTSVANEAAVRAYEKAGFEWRDIWHDPSQGPMWLLTSDRPEL
ncbi:MAG: acetyltransferase [Alphaproteobacteria bacterium]|nr:acetyltransferase [Alphaproteobacteria bacterium]